MSKVKRFGKLALILDIGLFIYYFVVFVYSIVYGLAIIKKDPLVYNSVCVAVSTIGSMIKSCTLAYTYICKCWEVHHRIHPWSEDDEKSLDEECIDKGTLKELALSILKESFIYPAVICSLYGFINEKSWEFNNALDWFHFIMFL